MYLNKRKCLHKKIVQLPEDWFATPAWPLLHRLVHQYGCRDFMWKHSLDVTNVKCAFPIQVEYAYFIFISLLLSKIWLWISHFRVTFSVSKRVLGANPFIWNWVVCMKLNLQTERISICIVFARFEAKGNSTMAYW